MGNSSSRKTTDKTSFSRTNHSVITAPNENQPRRVLSENVNTTRHSGPNRTHNVVRVTKIDVDIANNTKDHHTDEFEITDANTFDDRALLVIRRGQKFTINIEFDRDFNKATDDLRLVFQFGKNARPENGTYVEFLFSDRDVTDDWGAYIQSTDYKGISLTVMTSPACLVGQWHLNIDVVNRDHNYTTAMRYSVQEPIYILFNPWCKNDQVYFYEDEEKLLDEYVLKDTGKIYSGSYSYISAMHWDFGQFTGNILDCVLYLLESLPEDKRGDPVQVARKLSALINSPDEAGVLIGNWSGDYSNGTSPLEWAGSVAILNQYFRTKRPVGFGQCWVFSGLITTACRALGIPARSVTNFSSAHDTDESITIDHFEDEHGEPIKHLNTDSIWNFHVWNDVWMARPDLPQGYGGWQAVDATPQEKSKGKYRLGPTSLVAVKNGDVSLDYDGKFVFAEVNADRVNWLQYDNGESVLLSVDKTRIGKKMSTKKPFSQDREDVTDQYKYPEGSDEERAAVEKANMVSTLKHDPYSSASAQDVRFEFGCPPVLYLGETITVSLKIANTGTEERTISGTFQLSSMYYTGVSYKHIAKQMIDGLTLQPSKDKEIIIEVSADAYFTKLMDHCMCRISCLCSVSETKQISSMMEGLTLRKPELEIKAPEEAIVGNIVNVEVSFNNPLPIPLTRCELRVEGPHLQRPIIYKHGNVGAHEKFTGKFEMLPTRPGQREMIVYFNCDQIHAINSSHSINISKQDYTGERL